MPPSEPSPSASLRWAPHRRFSGEEYDRLVQAGILTEDEPVELINGELIVVSAQGPVHSALVTHAHALVSNRVGPSVHVRVQCPLALSPDGRPEPDLALVRGHARDFLEHHPTADDVLLVIEIAQSSLALDRAKASAYASAGVPVYWLIDIEARRLEERSEPRPDGSYGVTRLLDEEHRVQLTSPAVELEVGQLLP